MRPPGSIRSFPGRLGSRPWLCAGKSIAAPIKTGDVCGRTISNRRAQAMAMVAWYGNNGERKPMSCVWETGWCGVGEGREL